MKASTTGIFLHRISYSETSLIVDFYTEEFGRKSFLFKGGKKKGHALFPMSFCEIDYYGRQDSKLLNLTSVNNLGASSFQLDPVKSTIAFFMAEVVRKSFREEEHDKFVFNALRELIDALGRTENVAIYPIHFLIELSEIIGIQPYVESIQLDYPFFDLEEGIIRNGTLQSSDQIEIQAITLIANLINSEARKSSYKREVREKALDLLLKYFKVHVPNFDDLVCYEIVKEVLRA